MLVYAMPRVWTRDYTLSLDRGMVSAFLRACIKMMPVHRDLMMGVARERSRQASFLKELCPSTHKQVISDGQDAVAGSNTVQTCLCDI